MRISDWSSDVCSSDLQHPRLLQLPARCAGRGRSSGELFQPGRRVQRDRALGRLAPDRHLCDPAFRPEAHVLCGLWRSEEHTSELQSLMRISYAVFCLKKKNRKKKYTKRDKIEDTTYVKQHQIYHTIN